MRDRNEQRVYMTIVRKKKKKNDRKRNEKEKRKKFCERKKEWKNRRKENELKENKEREKGIRMKKSCLKGKKIWIRKNSNNWPIKGQRLEWKPKIQAKRWIN